MRKLNLDFETYSETDLTECGAYNYSQCPSTSIICLGWRVDGSRLRAWVPGKKVRKGLSAALSRGDVEIHAWNAAFERSIFNNTVVDLCGWKPIPLERFHCTQAQAAYYGLPRSLDAASKVFGGPPKDKEGHRVMLQMCKPNRKGQRDTDPDKLKQTYEYCRRDVAAESYIGGALPPLPKFEREVYLADQRINDRGVPIDVELCRGAVEIVEEAHAQAAETAVQVTCPGYDPSVFKTKVAQLDYEKTYPVVTSLGQNDRILNFLHGHGVFLSDLQEGTIRNALAGELPDPVRELLQARQDVNLASVKKFQAAINNMGRDGRVRGQFSYYAAITGRWGSRDLQLHNLKRVAKEFRPTPESLEAVRLADYGAVEGLGRPLHVLSSCVRSIVRARPGRVLIGSDYKSIECRVLHWLAGDETTLQKFRNGVDLYIDFASDVYGVPASQIKNPSDERSVGKAGVLGLGFMLGAKRNQANLKAIAGLDVSLDFAQNMVDSYRGKYVEIVSLWRTLERSAMACMKTGKTISGDRWQFSREKRWLTIKLPSGRKLYYLHPEIDPEGKYGPEITYHGPRGRTTLSPPKIIENIVQAVARDLLATALLRMEKSGLYTVAHCHDATYVESEEEKAKSEQQTIIGLMERLPQWAKGLPLEVESEISKTMK